MALVAALAVTVAACSSSPLLDGSWGQHTVNPGGVSIDFSLATAGGNITGTGTVCGVGPYCNPGAVAITGDWSGTSFRMTLMGGGGEVATYVGVLVGDNELSGTWTEGTSSGPSIFYRQGT